MFKAKIKITLRSSILDPQGKAVEHSVLSLGYNNVSGVRIGKYIELKINAKDREEAENITNDICNKLLANPVMEDYDFDMVEMAADHVES